MSPPTTAVPTARSGAGSLLSKRLFFGGAFGGELGEANPNPLFAPLAQGGPSAWWRARDYTSGPTLADQSGRGNAMTLVNSPAYDVAGGFFDLAPGHLSVASSADLNFTSTEDLTLVVVWRPLATAVAFGGSAGKANPNDGIAWFWNASGPPDSAMAMGIYAAAGQADVVTTATAIATGVDAVQALRRGTTVDAYYNGTVASTADNSRDATSAAPLLIGFGYSGSNGPADMRFYGAAVFRRALTLAEIALVGTYLRGL